MRENLSEPVDYKLELEGALIDKVLPGGTHISRFLSRPLSPLVDYFFRIKPTSALNNDFPNAEVIRGYKENWLSFGVRTVANPLDRPKIIDRVNDTSFSSFHSQELESGVNKITTHVEGTKVTAFVLPADFVPYSLRAMDIFPNRGEQVAVSATLRRIAGAVRKRQEVPAIAMTAAGLNRMVIFGDTVYIKSLNDSPVDVHVRRHIRETSVGIDTRAGAPYFTPSDLFSVLHTTVDKTNTTTNAPYLPGLDAYWLVTDVNGSFQAMSSSELRMADQQRGFRETIASICSTTGYINQVIDDQFNNRQDNLPPHQVNSIVLFTLNGERRIATIHGFIESNAIVIYRLAKYIIENQYSGAEGIEVALVDGGGSAGAIVQKRKKWMNKEPHTFDTSTLPLWALEHEIPMYTAFVSKSFVGGSL